MSLRLKNTLSGQIEEFKPINSDEVRMYNCGPTVYDYPHIGNLRSYVFADILKRTLVLNDYSVKQVINITDVGHLNEETYEDKLEAIASQKGKPVKDISKFFTEIFKENLKSLNIDISDISFPVASQYIEEQINFIKELEEKGFTYQTKSGLYFDTSKFPDYGKLGNINLEGLDEGNRVENKEKKNKTDFALWRLTRESEERQQEWQSPWGKGFPGWHIECSVMSQKLLGNHFDIHTGGIDHIPTHHNNEIAQSESLTGKPLANFWLHNAFLTIEGKKISKSLGNIITLDSLEEKAISPLALRYWLLGAKYSTPINYSENALKDANNALNKLIERLAEIKELGKVDENYKAIFKGFVNDDLNTPKALALVFAVLKDEELKEADKKATIFEFDKVLGLNLEKLLSELERESLNIPNEVKTLLKEREDARKNEEWKKADELRKKIESLGYHLKDSDSGTKIVKA